MALRLTEATSAKRDRAGPSVKREIFSEHADWIFSVDSIFTQLIVDKLFLNPMVVLKFTLCFHVPGT